MRVVGDAKDGLLPVTYKFCFARDLDAGLQYVFQGRHFTPKDHSEVVVEVINSIIAEVDHIGRTQPIERRRSYGLRLSNLCRDSLRRPSRR
jgi:hypothetical protein